MMNRSPRAARSVLLVLLLGNLLPALAATPAVADDFVVTSSADSGAGTLREAITNSNGTSGADTITFEIGTGPQTISLNSTLPVIGDGGLTIDGTTQDGFAAAPIIRIDGSTLTGAGEVGLDIQTQLGAVVIRGLMITNFPSHGIEVSNGGTLPPSVTIAGNYVGTDGTNDLGNARLTPADNGILVSGRSATIGGTTAADRNVISGNGSADTNGGSGIQLNGGIGGSVVQGNYIGLTANGVTALGQKYGVTVQQNGVTIGGSAAGAGNVISGNAHSGINLTGANATNAVIEGNFIGTNAAGIGAVENALHGILLNLAGTGTTIGGASAGDGNVIVGGVRVSGTSGTTIQGNSIGVDATESSPLGLTVTGIWLDAGNGSGMAVANTTIEDNLIGGAQDSGILIDSSTSVGGSESSDNDILGNFIGTDRAGSADLGNGGAGIDVTGPMTDVNRIGTLGNGNVIANNGGDGVQVAATSRLVRIRGNEIRDSGGLGIDLVDAGDPSNGITPNDATDADTGANDLLNTPTLADVVQNGADVDYSGSLDTAPNTDVEVDVYESSGCDLSGSGEGATHVASDTVNSGAGGTDPFVISAPGTVTGGASYTATATDTSGNTSEFSTCFTAPTGGGAADLSVSVDVLPASLVAGQPVQADIAIANDGPDDTADPTLDITLPAGAELAEPPAHAGIACDDSTPGTVLCLVETISSASDSDTLSLSIRTSTTPATGAGVSATISSMTSDPTPGNNSASDTFDTTDASPGFAPATSYDLGGIGAHGVATGDLDGTNGADLVVSSPDGTLSALLNNGDGTFGNAITTTAAGTARALVLGRFDAGTSVDVVVVSEHCTGGAAGCGQLRFLPGNGDGTFGAGTTKNITDWPREIAAGDFDADGNLDVVAASAFVGGSDSAFTFMAGDGSGGFANAVGVGGGGGRYGIAVTDVDGDGKDDVLTTSASQLSVFRRTTPGSFAAAVNDPVASTSSTPSPVILDANGDGVSDVAVSGNAQVLVGNVDGTFQAAQEQLASPDAFSLAKGDFNDDGQVDLEAALTSPAPGDADLQQLRGRGDGTFSVPASKTVTLQFDATTSIASHDLSGDGVPDLIVPNADDDRVTVLLAAPTPVITNLSLLQPSSGDTGFASIDANDIDFSKIDLIEGTIETSAGPLSAPIPAKPIPAKPIPAKPIPAKPIPAKPIPAKSLLFGLPDPVGTVTLGQVIDHQIPNAPSLTQIGVEGGWRTKLPPALITTPIQNLTFNDVITLSNVRNTLWSDFDFSQTALGSLPPSAFFYGDLPVSAIGLPSGTTWSDVITEMTTDDDYQCTGGVFRSGTDQPINPGDGTLTLVDLAIARCPIAYAPWDDMRLADVSFPGVAHTPLQDLNFSGIDVTKVVWKDGSVERTLADVLISDLASQSQLVNCAAFGGGGCTGKTLGDAQALEVAGTQVFLNGATFGPVLAQDSTDLGDLGLGGLLLGVIPADGFPYENVPLGRIIQAATPVADGNEITYSLSFTTVCPLIADTTATVDLPDRTFGYIDGTAELNGSPADPDTSQNGSLSWDIPDVCGGPNPGDVTIEFDVQPSPSAGSYVAHARVETGEGDVVTGDGPELTLTEATEPNDTIANATVIEPGSLIPATMSESGDRDYYKVDTDGLEVGSLVSLYLSHMQSDDDLVLYGSVPTNLASAPIPAKPIPAKSVGDQEGCLPTGYVLEPQTLDTVPSLGDVTFAVRGFSTNRSDQEEVVCTTVQPGDIARGFILLQATYHTPITTGADDTVLARATVTPPVDAGTCLGAPLGSGGTTPASGADIIVPGQTMRAGADALFVINAKRFGDLYGASAEAATIAKIQQLLHDPTSPVDGQILAIDSAVNGVDIDPGAGTLAYGSAPDAHCEPETANDIARRINLAIKQVTNDELAPNIVLVGTDDVIPFARLQDLTTLGNQVAYAPNLVLNGNSNPTARAMARGMFLSDGPYGTKTPIPYFGNFVYIPDVAVGRLVETPAQIQNQIDQYLAFDGVLDPKTALVTATDFSVPGGDAIAGDLQARADDLNARTVGDPYSVKQLSSSTPATGWTRAQMICRLNGSNLNSGCTNLTPRTFDPPGLVSINGHFDHFRTLPGNEDVGDLLTSQDFLDTAAPPGTLIFTIGCNSGVNVPDVYVTAPGVGQPNPALDWPQALAQRNGSLVANTGFGYGDTTRLAYSERLMKLFSGHLDGAYTIGDALTLAKGEYVGELGVYSTVDFKALQVSTLYGLPMMEISGRETPDDERERNTQVDVDTNLQSFTVTEPRRGDDEFVHPTSDLRSGDTGQFFVGPSAITAPGYPIQPKSNAFTMTAKDTTLRMHGAIITELSTHDVPNFDPVIAQTSLAGFFTGFEPPVQSGSFPTDYLNINTVQDNDFLVMYGGRFTANPNVPGRGTQRVYTQMTARGFYVPKTNADFTPPAIFSNTGQLVAGTDFATFRVQTEAAGVRAAYVMYRPTGSPDFVLQRLSGGSGIYTADVSAPGGVAEFFSMVVDAAGNVSYDTFKGSSLGLTTLDTTPPAGTTVTASPALPASGWYDDSSPIVVTIDSRVFTLITARLDNGPTTSVFGTRLQVTVPATPGIHRIDYTVNGVTRTYLVPVDGTPPSLAHTIGAPQSVSSGTYVRGSTPITVKAEDPNGVSSCTIHVVGPTGSGTRTCANGVAQTFTLAGAPYAFGEGVYTISLDAADESGNAGTGLGSFQVIRDDTGPIATGSVPGSPKHTAAGVTYVRSDTDLRINVTEPDAGSAPGSGFDECSTSVAWNGLGVGGTPVLDHTGCVEGDSTYRLTNATPDGPYRFSTSTKDNVTNTNSGVLDVTLDNTPPEFAQCPTVDPRVSGTLAANVTAGAGTITVNETASPPHVNFVITVSTAAGGSPERMLVTKRVNVSGNRYTYTVTRMFGATGSAPTHASGDVVRWDPAARQDLLGSAQSATGTGGTVSVTGAKFGMPPAPFYVIIENEQMLVTGVAGTAPTFTLTVVRGYGGSANVSHAAGKSFVWSGAAFGTVSSVVGTNTIKVAEGKYGPATVPFQITVGAEHMTVVRRDSPVGNVWTYTVARGIDGTKIVAPGTGTLVAAPPATPVYLNSGVQGLAIPATDNVHAGVTGSGINAGAFTIGSAPVFSNQGFSGGALHVNLTPSAVGTFALRLSATDNLGNASVNLTSVTSASGLPAQRLCFYEVIYKVSAFAAPVANDSVNSVKAGQSVATKWRVTDYNGVAVTDSNTFVEVTTSGPKSGTCDTVPEWTVALEGFKGASNLQNLGGGNFQFNWAVPKTAAYQNTCRTMALRLAAPGLVGPAQIPGTSPAQFPLPSRVYQFANFNLKK